MIPQFIKTMLCVNIFPLQVVRLSLRKFFFLRKRRLSVAELMCDSRSSASRSEPSALQSPFHLSLGSAIHLTGIH